MAGGFPNEISENGRGRLLTKKYIQQDAQLFRSFPTSCPHIGLSLVERQILDEDIEVSGPTGSLPNRTTGELEEPCRLF